MMNQANAAGLLQFLWSKFEAGKASDEELSALAGAGEEASVTARNLGIVVTGVACLVSTDADASFASRSGALQGDDLPSFLFNVGDQIKTIAEISFIGGEAAFLLSERYKARAEEALRRVNADQDSSRGRA